jgi:hypothetical protein
MDIRAAKKAEKTGQAGGRYKQYGIYFPDKRRDKAGNEYRGGGGVLRRAAVLLDDGGGKADDGF